MPKITSAQSTENPYNKTNQKNFFFQKQIPDNKTTQKLKSLKCGGGESVWIYYGQNSSMEK